MTREDWESQPALHWPRAMAGDVWSVVEVHHKDLRPHHAQSLRRGAMAGARGRRTLTLCHHLSMLWKSQGKEKITLFPSATIQKLTPLSIPVNAMGCAGGNLTALTPNLHPGCHKPHLSFWALSFCQSDRGYCAKPCRPFCWQEWDFHWHRVYWKTVVQQQWPLSVVNLENIRTPLIPKHYLCTLTYLNTNFKGANYVIGIKDSYKHSNITLISKIFKHY